jgi:signal transduction histidine kinase
MKFWQKAFFLTLVLFLLAFDALGYILVERSFALNREYTLQAAQTEYEIIGQSVYERVMQSSALYTELNPENLKNMIMPYANYYAGQGVYLALYQNKTVVYNNSPLLSPSDVQGEEARMYETESGLFCVIGNELSTPIENLRFVYVKNANLLLNFKSDMTRGFVVISVVIGLILSIVLLFLLVRLTRPFRRLGAAAVSIAQGDYSDRVDVRGNDEVGQFARSFNLMAAKVQEHIDTLTQTSESKERFINNLAHEMRTPITAISGYAEMLKIGNINAREREKSIDYIINQSRRMQSMVYKLTDLALMSCGHIEKKPIDIASVIANAQATCKAQIEGKQITLNEDIAEISIAGDAELLESLLQNLIENAVKYSEDGGWIDILTYSENGESVIAVSDCGRGMEESEISKITEPFYRVDKSRSRTDGGVGLGLALCARICEAHDARLTISSKIGVGTEIKICFTTP